MAENEAENPWEPLHVEHGFPADVSTVTMIGCEGPHNIQDHYSNTGLGILKIIAGAMGQAGSNNLLAFGHPLLSLGPEHAATIARDGYSKRQVKEFIFEHARFPLGRLGEEYRRLHVDHRRAVDSPDTLLPILKSPGDLSVIVVGGRGEALVLAADLRRSDRARAAPDRAQGRDAPAERHRPAPLAGYATGSCWALRAYASVIG